MIVAIIADPIRMIQGYKFFQSDAIASIMTVINPNRKIGFLQIIFKNIFSSTFPQYYIEGNYEAIIPREVFMQVQLRFI